MTAADADTTRAAEGRAARSGFLFITGAKVWFLLCATLLNLGLPRLLGDPAAFGDYGVVNSFISILNMVMVAGALQGVSKRVSERPAMAAAIRRHALRLQTAVGGALFLVLLLGAGPLTGWLFGDTTLAPLLRIAAVVTLSYSWYAALIGVLNGLKRFAHQALFDILFATLKVVLMIGLVLAGAGVLGAFAGFAAAAAAVMLVAWWWTGRTVDGPAGGPAPPLAAFMVQVMGYVLCVNLLIQADVLVVKRAALEPVQRALGGAPPEAWAAMLGDQVASLSGDALVQKLTAALAGVFRATKNVALLPYQAVIAITFVVFPLISRSTFESDAGATSSYVRQALRTSLLLVALVATGLAAGGEPLLALLFGDAYRVAAPALLPMLGGMALLAVFYVVGSMLTAAGHPAVALVIAAVTVVVQLVAVYLVSAASPPTGELLWRATVTVLITTALGTMVALGQLSRCLRVPLPWLAFARLGAASAAGVGLAQLVPGEGFGVIFVRAALAGIAFVGVTLVTREVTAADLALVRQTLGRRRKG